MRSLEFYVILTADGMYADPDGGLDHYDPAEDEHRFANELLRASGGEIMGRRMYDVMDYWDELDVARRRRPRSSASTRSSGGRLRSTSSRAGPLPSARTPRCSRAMSSRRSAS